MNIKNVKIITLLAAILFILSGCASHDRQQLAESLAKIRASAIDSKAPYPKIDAYQITKAYATKNTVKINIVYGGKGRISPTQVAKATAQSYCNNPEIKTLFEQGVNYMITIRDMSGRKLIEQPVSESFCNPTEE